LTIGSRLVVNHRDKGLVEVKEVSRACHQVRLDVCMGSLGRAIDPLTEVPIAVNVTLHPLLRHGIYSFWIYRRMCPFCLPKVSTKDFHESLNVS
jgi:hypothetical protein